MRSNFYKNRYWKNEDNEIYTYYLRREKDYIINNHELEINSERRCSFFSEIIQGLKEEYHPNYSIGDRIIYDYYIMDMLTFSEKCIDSPYFDCLPDRTVLKISIRWVGCRKIGNFENLEKEQQQDYVAWLIKMGSYGYAIKLLGELLAKKSPYTWKQVLNKMLSRDV